MNLAYNYQQISENSKIAEMKTFLRGTYWENDVWDISDPFFDGHRPGGMDSAVRRVVFSEYSDLFKLELKYYFAMRVLDKTLQMITLCGDYQFPITLFCNFLTEFYPKLHSFSEVSKEIQAHWLEHTKKEGYQTYRSAYKAQVSRLHSFFSEFYDTREEFEKDIWDFRKIPGVTIPVNSSTYRMYFAPIPPAFRELAKRYLKLRITSRSSSQVRQELDSITCFLQFIANEEPNWTNLKALTRQHIENFLVFYLNTYPRRTPQVRNRLLSIRKFLQRIQQFNYPDAPLIPAPSLLFYEEIPSAVEPPPLADRMKFIPEGVMMQLKEHLEHLTPSEYIPIVIVLMASGWRAGDVLGLKYDNCLEHTAQGWYLRGDISKTRIKNHRVPITNEVKSAVEAVAQITKAKSTEENNPQRLLFNLYSGKRMGKSPINHHISRALNQLAQKYNITDDQGNIHHFTLHSFRHTKGVELINNGMSLVHVQKWMAHMSPEMTLVYAKVLDTTLRKSWEKAVENGIFRITPAGNIRKIDISDAEDEDLIEWEYIKHNLDAVRMPLGFCMKPKKQACFTQLSPCLTCRNLCTTADFLPQYEIEIQETKTLIERGKVQGREVWVEKNQHLLERYEEIVTVLRSGHTRHAAGKKGREYIGEERVNVQE